MNTTENTPTESTSMNTADLIPLTPDIHVTPRIYRMFQRAARTAWSNDLQWVINDVSDCILDLFKNELHIYTKCVRLGITRIQYEDGEIERCKELAKTLPL